MSQLFEKLLANELLKVEARRPLTAEEKTYFASDEVITVKLARAEEIHNAEKEKAKSAAAVAVEKLTAEARTAAVMAKIDATKEVKKPTVVTRSNFLELHNAIEDAEARGAFWAANKKVIGY